MRISALNYYPIKSCKGWSVNTSLVTARGLENDRNFMLVNAEGDFLTQREIPRMALITPTLVKDQLILQAEDMDDLTIPISYNGEGVPITVWSHDGDAIDQGDAVAEWFSKFLEIKVRLVRMEDNYIRRVNPQFAVSKDDHVSFADAYPILVASDSGLSDLNSRLKEALPMNRFRPNIVIEGCEPFEEDRWKRIRIGEVELALVKPCARCEITTTNQLTAERGKEPLKTLATFRRFNGKVMFGQNAIPITLGEINVGDEVEVLEYKD